MSPRRPLPPLRPAAAFCLLASGAILLSACAAAERMRADAEALVRAGQPHLDPHGPHDELGSMECVGLSSGEASAGLSVTEAWTSEGLAWADRLSDVKGVGQGPDGSLWIADYRAGVLVVEPPFTGPAKVLKHGGGGREVTGLAMFDVTPEGRMAVYDVSRETIEVFSPSGDFVSRAELPVRMSWTKGFAVLASGDYLISGAVDGIRNAIHQFAPDGRLLQSFGEPAVARDRQAVLVGTGGALRALSDGSFLYTQGAPHRVVRYAPGAGARGGYWREEVIAEHTDMFDAPGDGVIVPLRDGRGFNVTYPQSRGVTPYSDDMILNVVVMRDEGRSVWQILDAAPEADDRDHADRPAIAEERVDEAYIPWFNGTNGAILAHRVDPETGAPVIVGLELKLLVLHVTHVQSCKDAR